MRTFSQNHSGALGPSQATLTGGVAVLAVMLYYNKHGTHGLYTHVTVDFF